MQVAHSISRWMLMVGSLALVTGPASPLSSAPKRAAVVAIEADSPVRCNREEATYTGQPIPRGRLNGIAAQGAPLPVPPPPLAVAPAPVIVATAKRFDQSRVAQSSSIVAPSPFPQRPQREDRERYKGETVASIKAVASEPVSTFSVDVDTGSYANVRRFLTQGQMPPADAVRTEEMLNYFRYDYPLPKDRSRPFSVTTDVATTPWNADTRLLRIGIRGYDLPRDDRPPSNLVFLVDVSGSMSDQDKLPLVKSALALLADRLSARDKVSIVVYAGAAGIVLDPTSNPRFIKQALDCLQAGGSTAGGQGMELAYATARTHFIKGGVNRVIMATDGDFNVGISSNDGIEAIVKKNREDGITLTTLGFGQGNYNEAMMERVADIGNGNYAYIDTALEAQKVLDEEMQSTLFTIAKDVKIQLEFNPAAVSEYRLIGYENRALAEQDFNNDRVDAGDIGSGHQVTALYEIVPTGAKGWRPDRRYPDNQPRIASSKASGEMGWLKLRYKMPDGQTSSLIEQPISRAALTSARAPAGDMAFAVAVAGFGQKLRGDKYLGNFTFADVRRTAGAQNGYLRQEFLKLASLADQ
ncbi:MAG: vWA domain-containing protein [Sphingomonadaceae bacterium]